MQRVKSLRTMLVWTAAALACVLAVFPPAMAALISISPQTGLGIAFSPANWTLDHYRTVFPRLEGAARTVVRPAEHGPAALVALNVPC